MKKSPGTFAALALALCLAAGCSDHEIHLDKVRAALQGLPDPQKTQLEEGLTDIAASNYVAALKPLQLVAYGAKLDNDQRKILEDTLSKVKEKANQAK